MEPERQETDVRKALEQALRFLGVREHSRAEITGKLQRSGYEPDVIERTLRRLEELSLVDDLSFARNFIRSRTRGKPSGYHKLRYELMRKGVGAEISEKALEEYDGAAQCERAALKKLPFLNGDMYQKRRKLYSHLQNRGFDGETIRETLDNVLGP
ncbi:regulatory protein RecX [Prosthecochloris sp. HL-130-GSB]|jgi:regulatory protein|uniref:Regulatory protein RecX n=1 Tax=Prosthecochloris aestuarii TaxID=1102 RepID=A0A831SL35_PROAE|nr:regulatory protein RecX [Prosthecochloris sp. HL-130-GSB]ARM31420.1 regulatory protein RecX [Prosthecochloris sp. HL-130-GSB]MBO8093762.1 regulatory protein RecX [Prosthecochloris sp.]HED30102.1 regulatory protein RecX [Prosthecochloris aestuarii]